MPSITEAFNSRSSSDPQGSSTSTRWHKRRYLARGYPEDADARAAIAAYLDTNSLTSYDGIPLASIDLSDDYGDGDWVYEVRWESQQANFGGGDPDTPGEDPYEFSFDIGTSSFKMTRSYGTAAYSVDSTPAPGFNSAIGVNSKGEAQGVDVVSPTYSEERSYRIPAAAMTLELRAALFNIVRKVNNNTFSYFGRRECRVDGIRGSRLTDGSGDYRLTIRYAGQPSKTISFGGTSYPIPGWDYVWYYSTLEPVTVTSGGTTYKFMSQVNKFMYIETVYEEEDFAFLAALSTYGGP